MKKIISFSFITFCIVMNISCTDYSYRIKTILNTSYEHKIIASRDNYPVIDLRTNYFSDICILFHHRIPSKQIKKFFEWTDEEFNDKLSVLLEKNLIKPHEEHGYLPTFMIISLEDGQKLKSTARKVSTEAVPIISEHYPEVRKIYDTLKGFKHLDFSRSSLFILSDVLLDAWQINDIERLFLKKERTLRNGKNYYLSIQESRREQNTEAFGIYGNTYQTFGELVFGLYGNTRTAGTNFLTITELELLQWFGMEKTDDVIQFKTMLLRKLVKLAEIPNYEIKDQLKQGYEALNLIRNKKLAIPVIYPEDNRKLLEMKNLITENLVQLLENNRAFLLEHYNNSPYSQEVTPEEYLIWWYHFFYTELTELLITRTIIQKPISGTFSYIVKLK